MPREILQLSERLPHPIGPYSMAVAGSAGSRILFISGQSAVAEDGSLVGKGDIRAQTVQTFMNLFNIIQEAGGTINDLVKVTIFLKDFRDLPTVVEVRREIYGDAGYPATSTVQVKLASDDMLIEVEGIAFLKA